MLIDFNGYFQGQKGRIWTFVIYLGHYLRNGACCDNVCIKHIYKVIYDISVDFVTFDLELPVKVKSRSPTFQTVVSHKCASYDQSLYEIHRVSHIWPFSLTCNI